MTQVIENWALLVGVVRALHQAPESEDMLNVVVEVEGVQDVDAYPNLMRDAVGRELTVTMPSSTVESKGITAGARIRCRTRVATPSRCFADPKELEMLEDAERDPGATT